MNIFNRLYEGVLFDDVPIISAAFLPEPVLSVLKRNDAFSLPFQWTQSAIDKFCQIKEISGSYSN